MFDLFLVISRIGTILVDGKVYPPVQTPSGSITPPAGPPQMPPQMTHQQQIPPQQQQNQHQQQQHQQLSQPQAHQQQQQQQQQSSRQRQSPNVTPPLRPLLPQGSSNTGYNTSPNLFQSGSQFPPGMRAYTNDSRFPMPGHPSMGPPQTHVSSSTHPNMGNGEFILMLLLKII